MTTTRLRTTEGREAPRAGLALLLLVAVALLLAPNVRRLEVPALPTFGSFTPSQGSSSVDPAVRARVKESLGKMPIALPGGGVKTIAPAPTLPPIAGLAIINGYTQAGAAPALATGLAMQFRSAGHVLGFTSEGYLVAGRDHLLKVNFVGAAAVAPEATANTATEP